MTSLLYPQWPLPQNVTACSTTRKNGVSLAPFASLNLGDHVGDDPRAVKQNRLLLEKMAGLPSPPIWLEQIHGVRVLRLTEEPVVDKCADAVYTSQPGQVCAVMTADCLPVLFCAQSGNEVAAAHAGWRGLCDGVLENTVKQFNAQPTQITAWLGPAIGPEKFEVGQDVYDAFVQQSAEFQVGFIPYGDKFLANIYLLARLKLQALGITSVCGGTDCTVTDSDNFFSYRRQGKTGRMASLIWFK